MTELTALYFGRDFLNILKDSVFHDSLKSGHSPVTGSAGRVDHFFGENRRDS
jgi:hypothetical protein